MTGKRFTLKHFEDTDWAYDNNKPIHTKEMVDLLNELQEENEQYKKKSISLKQLYKILEETKEHFLSLSECFTEKLLIKTIFRNIDENIESMEEEE